MPGLVCAVHQPNFFPRLSTLAKLYAADVWVILDDVQFSRRDYQHRCYLPAAGAALPACWLTVPVHLPAGRATLIRDARIADPALAARRVRDLLRQYFRTSPHRAAIWGLLAEADDAVTSSIRVAESSERTTTALLEAVGWRGRICRSSGIAARTGRSERLADLTTAVSATAYLCGTGGSRYLDPRPSPHKDWQSSSSPRRPGSRACPRTPADVPLPWPTWPRPARRRWPGTWTATWPPGGTVFMSSRGQGRKGWRPVSEQGQRPAGGWHLRDDRTGRTPHDRSSGPVDQDLP
jgi:WbqC-like protein family